MKRIVLILLTAFAFSCAERELQLPVTTANDITEILDVSPIYMFYDEATDSVDFNRKNMISTTNWLVNIDKRLTLKQILPHLQYLQEKRRGDGMHKNENAKNYFTCFNENTQNLSFVEFTDIDYKMTNIKKDSSYIANLKTKAEEYLLDASYHARSTLSLVFNENQNIKIGNEIILINQLHEKLSLFIEEYNFLGFSLRLYFNENLSFQDYITYKSKLLQLDFENINIRNDEFIYN